ncbi:4-(cytidine 5'-diphospho)-2-C-methyl-D-erythritol kinase [Proteiniclasticum sp. QWL-01]|uniref:4-(cytidine 5'-diphospho)-2-C-methyl-D-erythritol kinase n=1 Tax=Proteiniclasticum sp. QWL-01 TaxID=3036945 RepID=UPI002410E278|nr:4-(cytidine 5'-diphospho)-2-C-methyl-D-erythritol kinase [Proteiniclasticum sp. QWL-01]WFF74061.1 4-(cytidine 5'-diphospho)-2-C-methyl-D-erythritol kinase [Proteiniclasticum sp. QWL-01]
MKIKAYAKINLTLDVTGKRADGYHLLQMVMQTIDLADDVSVELAGEGIALTCNLPYVPVTEKNIAYRAAVRFLEATGIHSGVRIHLEKRIPVAAGLAGGSTDAGAVLTALNGLTGHPLTQEKLLELGLSLGADVPFTMTGGTALCEGVGEIITPLPDFCNHWVLLVKPPFGVSTRQVFTDFRLDRVRRHPATQAVQAAIAADDLAGVARHLGNVLENVTLTRHPLLRNLKTELIRRGALGSLMSGSGPTVFGLFDSEAAARDAYVWFHGKYPETFLVQTLGRQAVAKG